MSDGYIHGGTDAREVARLEKQADFVSAFTFPRVDAAPGHRVLDLACGVGAMASRLLRAFPGIALVGVDLSAPQLRACRQNHPALPVARATGAQLPFADQTFDRVHCSWLLEHVAHPAGIVREVRRVLKPGGACHFIEVDNRSLSTRPHLPEVHALVARLNAAQRRAGGDPFIGPTLEPLFEAAGFSQLDVSPVALVGTQADRAFLGAFIEEWAEIFESLDESLGHETSGLIERASAQLRGLLSEPDVELRYAPWLVRAVR
ncbi:MAG: class I SAM-dependent methyltransferase [Myxococcus sp.]|nr:class I SAM-dependent methyltransferase [Myxococcus sp.]